MPREVKCLVSSCGLAGEHRGRVNSTAAVRYGGFYLSFDPSTTYGNCSLLDGAALVTDRGSSFFGGKYSPPPNRCKNADPLGYPGVGGALPVYLAGSSLSYAFLQTSGAGFIRFYLYPVPATSARSPSVVFRGNSAGLSGGGLYIGSGNTNVYVMPGTVFAGNRAAGQSVVGMDANKWSGTGSGGGGMWMDADNKIVYVLTGGWLEVGGG